MKRNTDHVVLGHNSFECLHCGGQQKLAMPMDINVLVGAGKGFTKSHAGCKKPEGELCDFCHGRGHSFLDCKEIDTPDRWNSAGRDKGASSDALRRAANGGLVGNPPYPIDAGDFGRCYRLVKRWPEMLRGVAALGMQSPVWAEIAAEWDGLCSMYETKPTKVSKRLAEFEGRAA